MLVYFFLVVIIYLISMGVLHTQGPNPSKIQYLQVMEERSRMDSFYCVERSVPEGLYQVATSSTLEY